MRRGTKQKWEGRVEPRSGLPFPFDFVPLKSGTANEALRTLAYMRGGGFRNEPCTFREWRKWLERRNVREMKIALWTHRL
jgi:hypothetical protein